MSTSELENPFQFVQSHGDTCGNCFRRTHVTQERNYAVDTIKVDDFEWEPWARKVDLPDRKWPVDENRAYVPLEPSSRGNRGICKCGYPSGETLRPLPKELFFSYARHLLKRYSEFGIQIDREAFIRLLKDWKSDPSKQFADDRLYEKATIQALKR